MEVKEQTIKKRPIAAVLRAMKVGDVEYFPVEQYDSVSTGKTRMGIILRPQGVKFSQRVDGNRIRVERLS